MNKLSLIKSIAAGAVVGFLSFKLHGDAYDVSSGIICVCVGMVYALIIEDLVYLCSKKKDKTD